jgi:hypothetical protein
MILRLNLHFRQKINYSICRLHDIYNCVHYDSKVIVAVEAAFRQPILVDFL